MISKNPMIQITNGCGYPLEITTPNSGLNYEIPSSYTDTRLSDLTNITITAYAKTGAVMLLFELSVAKPSILTFGNYTCTSSYDPVNQLSQIVVSTNSALTPLWDTSTSILKFNGNSTVLHGIALSGMEYLLSSIGMKNFATYNKESPENIFSLNTSELDAIIKNFPQMPHVTPAVTIYINGNYYLNILTPSWSGNASLYPNLSTQYQNLLDQMLTYFHNAGIVTILDLQWSTDDPNGPHDPFLFWELILKKYKNNPLVWYELHNETNDLQNYYNLWRDGVHISGMKPLYQKIRANTIYPIVITDSFNSEISQLIQFHEDVRPEGVLYNCQTASMLPTALEAFILQLFKVPVIFTQTSQYCCPSVGRCNNYTPSFEGAPIGYLEALLQLAQKYQISWILKNWRPNDGNSNNPGYCMQSDINSNTSLIKPMSCNPSDIECQNQCGGSSCGADISILLPKYFPMPLQ